MKPISSYALARYLHDSFCNRNHADYCRWYYEIDKMGINNWSQSEHKYWLNKANLLTVQFGIPTLEK